MHAANTAPATTKPATIRHEVRLTGTVQAVRFFTVQVPHVIPTWTMTLTRIIGNGAPVKTGDLLAEFDRTAELDNARDARAKFDDLSHQVEQSRRRSARMPPSGSSDLQAKPKPTWLKPNYSYAKDRLLSEIDRLKNEVKAEAAREHVASLKNPAGSTIRRMPPPCAFWNCSATGRKSAWIAR